jgi:transcriptional regulator with XRE-family HTH domain
VADATVSRVERGRLAPSAALAVKLAGALGVKVDELMSGTMKPARKAAMRPSVARLVAVVSDLDDAQVDDITRGLKLLLAAGRRSGGLRRTPT